MKIQLRMHTIGILSIAAIAGSVIACAPAQFSSPQPTCGQSGNCSVNTNGNGVYDYTMSLASTPLDILFVDDNSGSMSKDQQSLGNKFSSLFNSISGFDYHIAITTTDMSGTGLQGRDGSLVDFGGGVTVLNSSTANVQSLFVNGIVRPETLTCDQYLASHNCAQTSCNDYYQYCASDDSRAIDAANTVVLNNPSSFLRNAAPLHVVIISNSDERVNGGATTGRPLESVDEPNTLIQSVASAFGGTKPLYIHTIIIQPGDSSCLQQEVVGPLIFGQYAPVYSSASSMTGGVRGTICASDYSAQLAQIGNQAASRSSIPLNCQTSNANLTYTLNPTNSSLVGTVDSTGMILQFNAPIPASTQVHLHYTCLSGS